MGSPKSTGIPVLRCVDVHPLYAKGSQSNTPITWSAIMKTQLITVLMAATSCLSVASLASEPDMAFEYVPDMNALRVPIEPQPARIAAPRFARSAEPPGLPENFPDIHKAARLKCTTPAILPEPIFQEGPEVRDEEFGPGYVVVDFVIDPKGRVIDPFVAKSSNHRFDACSVRTVAGWLFKPGTTQGRPVWTHHQQPFVFAVGNIADLRLAQSVKVTSLLHLAIGGVSWAQNNVGSAFARGEGVKQDYVRAHFWWMLAAVQGNQVAQRNLRILEAVMPARELAEARKTEGFN